MMAYDRADCQDGLYDPRFEHDNCGVGFVANIKGKRSHDIIEKGISILLNLVHRGAIGGDAKTGDGAGILFQIPHEFFVKVCKPLSIDIPDAGTYGAGIVFLPQNQRHREDMEKNIERIAREEGQKFLGWRTVPYDPSDLGELALRVMPVI
ncbi:hypothetical protein KDK77_03810, partial [bacterium]|nr:hypothetical protein [bacterium]